MNPYESYEFLRIPRTHSWFLACNPARFPYMFGKPDPRNALLAEKVSNQL